MLRRTPYLALLLLASCWGAQDNALFEATGDQVSAPDASAAGSFAASPGTDSGSGAATSGASGAMVGGGGTVGSGGTVGGGGGGTGATSSSGGTSEPAGDGGAAGAPLKVPVITDCAMVEGASIGDNGHCYRVNEAELDFAAASEACAAAGGHLVTIASEVENELAEQLHDGEHWLGASDGRADSMPGVGTYTWVDGSVWDYSYWEDDQPNAFETDCPDDDESDCYEHCAFQTDEGDWNDRSCWHTIPSICEWDVEAEPPVEAAAGAGGAEP